MIKYLTEYSEIHENFLKWKNKFALLIFSIYYKSTPERWNDMIFKIKNLNAILKTGARWKKLFLWQIPNWDFYKEKL